MDDVISRQAAIDLVEGLESARLKGEIDLLYPKVVKGLIGLPSAQPEPYLDSIVSEIENTISETKKRGRHHEIHIRTNGEMICYGLQLALEIIEEKRNEQTT